MTADTIIRPQPGPQEQFLSSPADIVIYGGSAGGGKTFALLLEGMRHSGLAEFGAVIFRRESTQITNEGGLWDSAMQLYPQAGARPFKSPKLGFAFPAGARVTFGHLNQEADVLNWQGAQIPLICFDELTHFSRAQFFYMLSRNRSTCGVRPYVRATTNPDADSWVAEFIGWWIDDESGLPIPERAGALRYFVRVDDAVHWADSREALAQAHGVSPEDAKSVTFIPASVFDNQALLERDPGYLANLKALGRVERARLLEGNWRVRPAAGLYFPRHAVTLLDVAPTDIVERVRSWDLAGTEPTQDSPSPDATAGVLMGLQKNGRYVVLDVAHLRARAHRVRQTLSAVAQQDGHATKITIPQDPGQAGKDQAASIIAGLAGYSVSARRPSSDKITRAEPLSAQWQAGNVDVLRGPWAEAFLAEMESFPVGHDDQVDAAADAFAALARGVTDYSLARSAGQRAAHHLDDAAPTLTAAGWGTVAGASKAYGL
ncbi:MULTISPECIES: phage terminase large subunit [Marichromatium]|uniref:Putative phage terminase large subunit-like protein n=1 Tax=Marichromatium gracile TaxID=1048 RepID=A0A4R4A4K0_MARGR|nr:MULTISPECIES: phage terminase large subunit [Marichromatium]MBK1709812.1 terminase [Marichromatium gracile]RNE89867.1 terminase [Marichromatium sp. AB31]TCW32678.1 putative phage terminase large subunit-like protein [Marichromatium gracile]